MITNFEEITEDLTEMELKILPEIDSCFRLRLPWGHEKPIKQPRLVELINYDLQKKFGLFLELKMSEVRIRKYFNYFRSRGILPIIATSKGCFLSYNKEYLGTQIQSLEERARSIQKAADGLKAFL